MNDIFKSYFNFSLMSIILFGSLVIIPFSEIFLKDMIQVTTVDKYEDEYFNFNTNYEIQNPMTKRHGLSKMLERLLTRKIFSHEEYQEYAQMLSKGEFVDLLEIYKEKIKIKEELCEDNQGLKINNYLKKFKTEGGLGNKTHDHVGKIIPINHISMNKPQTRISSRYNKEKEKSLAVQPGEKQ